MVAQRQIRLLPDQVVNKIAAGEVVERPASVLKELVENALDAASSNIEVDVVSGGKKLLAVSDNGTGMGRDDALLCIERHATSKIRDVDDIEKIDTLGFRGEALAAIASVSQFTLVTRPAESLTGTEILITGGKMQDVRDAGCPVGTTVKIRNLFFNVPARRKFLRTEQTELAHLRQVFLLFALSQPGTAFKLTADGREVYRLAGPSSVEDRIRELFGPDLASQLKPVRHAAQDIRITGYAGLPQASRADRTEQYIFINKRAASSPVVNYAVSEAYHTLLPKGRYPVLFLYVEIDPLQVDVNVHPTKKEVRFRKPAEVRDAVIEAIRQSLSAVSDEGVATGAGAGSVPPPMPAPEPLLKIENLPPTRTFAYPRLPMIPVDGKDRAGPAVEHPESSPAQEKTPSTPWSWCRVLGQVGGLYVVMETEEGLVLMDPHAAHERLLYERFMKEVLGNHVRSQGLLTPETVDVMPREAELIRKQMDLLRNMGFGISEFGGDTFILDALPACLSEVSGAFLLAAVAQSMDQSGGRGASERWQEDMIAQAACKAAVKAHDKLTLEEIEKLVVDLAHAEMPYTCPHGRPTVIFMGFNELNRKFGRA